MKTAFFAFACVAFASTQGCAVSTGTAVDDSTARPQTGQIVVGTKPDPNPPQPPGIVAAPGDWATYGAAGQIIIKAPPDPNPPTPGGH